MADRPSSKTVFIGELIPDGRKYVEFSIELANTVGALTQVASILSKHNVNIQTGYHDAEQWSFFADITEIDITLEGIVKEISSLAVVTRVILGKEVSGGGVIPDTLHQQLVWGPFRFLIVRADFMNAIFQRVRGIFGADGKAGKVVIHGMGAAAGQDAYRRACELGTDFPKTHVEDILATYMAQGVGEFRLLTLNMDNATASVQVNNSFECTPFKGKNSTQSDFIRGYLAGFFSEIFGERVDATESLCVARGSDRCLYEIASTTEPTPGK